MRVKEKGYRFIEKIVWWKVDFGKVFSIYSVVIFFKNYEGYGM